MDPLPMRRRTQRPQGRRGSLGGLSGAGDATPKSDFYGKNCGFKQQKLGLEPENSTKTGIST